jgi:hypothetical protein
MLKSSLIKQTVSEMVTTSFAYGDSYGVEDRSYDDSNCWEDCLSGDEYEEWADRRRFEQSNPYGV